RSGLAELGWGGSAGSIHPYQPASGRERQMATRQSRTLARIMMAPSVLVLLVWMIVPLALTLWFSFQNYNLLNPITNFAGWSNYYYFLTDPAFLQSIGNTLILVVGVLLITVVGGTFL